MGWQKEEDGGHGLPAAGIKVKFIHYNGKGDGNCKESMRLERRFAQFSAGCFHSISLMFSSTYSFCFGCALLKINDSENLCFTSKKEQLKARCVQGCKGRS